MSQGERMRRVDEGLREVVSSTLAGTAGDQLAGLVTVTGVQTSPDLRHATVFVSVFGSAEERARSFATLEELRTQLQHEIAAHLRMKNTPVLKFENDETAERASRVNELIDEEAEFFDERSH